MRKFAISAVIFLLAGCNIPNEYKRGEEKKNDARENFKALLEELPGWTVADTTITMEEADMGGLAKKDEKFYEWHMKGTLVKGTDTLYVETDDFTEVLDSLRDMVPGYNASIRYREFSDDYPEAEKKRINNLMDSLFGNRKSFTLDKDYYDVVTVRFSKPKKQR